MADGNEALSVDQLSSVMSVANTSGYGLVKVMTDEQLDAYMNGGSGADNDDIPLEQSDDIDYGSFGFKASCSNGTVSIQGDGDVNFQSMTRNRKYVMFVLPEGYRPSSQVTTSRGVNVYYGGYPTYDVDLSVIVNTNGEVYFTAQSNYDGVSSITLNSRITFDVQVSDSEEPDGIYIVTVQQAIKYLDKISGSGGGSTDSDDVVLYEGTASWSGDYYDIAGPMNDPTEFSGFTVEFSSGMTVEFGQVEQSGSSSQWTAYDDAGEYILIIVGIPGNFMFAAGGAHVPNPSTVYKLIGHK